MATTSSVGAASTSAGTLDVPSLVSQLMTVERQPINNLNTQVSTDQTKISSLGTIKGLVSGLQTAAKGLTSNLTGFSATSSDTGIVTTSASSTAVSGTYSLAVTALAQAQNLAAFGQTSTAAAIGSGTSTTVNFVFGTGTKSVTIDSTNNTLQGIKDAINAANIGVTATIVNDGSANPYRLVLASNSSGASNGMQINTTAGGDAAIGSLLTYPPGTTTPMTQTIAAQDASFTLNGIPMTSSSNTIPDAIQGVSLTLLNKTTAPVTVTVAHDTSAISKAATIFVDAYNALYNQMKSRSAYGTSTSAGGDLSGDGTIRGMMDQLRGIFMTGATGGTLTSLAQAGISTQTDGTLKLDSVALNNALTSNYNDVVNLFSSPSGFATRLDTWATSVVSAGGLIDSHITNINSSIKGLTNQISQLEYRMTVLQAQYTTQYSNLNMLLTSMNSTSAYLTQQFVNTK